MSNGIPKASDFPQPTAKPINVAVMAESVQLMDIAGIDCIANASPDWLAECVMLGTGPLIQHATPMNIHWLASTLEPARMTGNIHFKPTITYDDCPRDLDILLIGGPLFTHRPAAADRFMKEAFARTKVVMTTCTGAMWLASSGVLKGLRATTNRGALDAARQMHPEVTWEDQRWVVSQKEGGELWTSGGAQAGEYSF